MLNKIKLDTPRNPMPRPIPGMPPKAWPAPAPGRQDDGIGSNCRPYPKPLLPQLPKPRLPQPGDIYIGGPGPKNQKQFDAQDLENAGTHVGKSPKNSELRPVGPFLVQEPFKLK